MVCQRLARAVLRSAAIAVVIAASLSGCGSLKDRTRDFESPFGANFMSDTVVAQGFDATDVDLWTMDNLWWSTSSIFKDMNTSCIQEEINCPKSQRKDKKEFKSKDDFHKDHANKFGLDLGASWKGTGGKFNIGVDNKDDIKNNRDERITWWRLSQNSRCVKLDLTCMREPAFFNPEARKTLDELAKQDGANAPDDTATMQRWYDRFVKVFGSHIVTKAKHGASVQALHTVDNSCQSSDICRNLKLGISISFAEGFIDDFKGDKGDDRRLRRLEDADGRRRRAGGDKETIAPSIDFGFEYERHKCDTQSSCLDLSKTKCAAIGGGDGGVVLCEPEAPPDILQQFLNGGDPNDPGSAYNLNLVPIQDVIASMPGLEPHSKQVGKAVDFAACKLPLGEWKPDNRGGHACTCVLTCDAGWALDIDKCACKCQNEKDGCKPKKPDFPDPWGPGSGDPFGGEPGGWNGGRFGR